MATNGAGSSAEVVSAQALTDHELGKVSALQSELAIEHVGAIPGEGGIGLQGMAEVESYRAGVVPGAEFLPAAQIDHAGGLGDLRCLELAETAVFGIEGAQDGGRDIRRDTALL